MKKFLLGMSAAALAVASVPMFAAFEAHVLNVTARIENALTVDTKALDFGTVFPQEHLEKPMSVTLSGSFLGENRVDDVSYFIRQKPKCAITINEGKALALPETTATGHVVLNTQTSDPNDYTIDCGPAPRQLTTDETWGVLPSLCEYISKEGEDQNDGTTLSFHKPFEVVDGQIRWLDTRGYLTKAGDDTVDNWVIDLAVPCF